MKLGLLPLGRPTFDVDYANEKLAGMLAALDATGHVLTGPRDLLFDEASTRAAMADLQGFAETGKHHQEVHRLALEIVALVNQGEHGKANQLMKSFNDSRTCLFGELDTLYCA